MQKNENLRVEDEQRDESVEQWAEPRFEDESACAELCAYVFTA